MEGLAIMIVVALVLWLLTKDKEQPSLTEEERKHVVDPYYRHDLGGPWG